MSIVVGIDLGTTNTMISLMTENGVQPLEPFGHPNLPSCLLVQNNTVKVGYHAKNRRSRFPDAYISNAKPFMPNQKTWEIDGVTYTPKDVAREVLKAAVTAIREETGCDDNEEIHAVITVPACFTSLAAAATKQAAEEAGLVCLKLETEPVAAAIAYQGELQGVEKLLVVDTGGGTFDLAVIHVDQNALINGRADCFSFDESVDIDGDPKLGGNDFDQVILEKFLLPNLRGGSSTDPSEVCLRNQLLLDMATEIKEYLQGINITECHKTHTFRDGSSIDVTVTLSDYISACGDLLARMSYHLNAIKTRSPDIGKVLLVGGMAGDPCIRQLVREIFPDIPSDTPEQYMNLIAAGAAVEAGHIEQADGLSFINAVTYTAIGIAVDDADGKQVFSSVIPKGSRIAPGSPLAADPQFYTTNEDNLNEIVILVLESTGKTDAEQCVKHGRYTIAIPPLSKGEFRLCVKMSLDINRELTVRCENAENGEELMFEVLRLI